MSTNTIFKSGAIAAMTLAGLSITVAANAQSSRYGNVYDYESGRNCGQACVAPAPAGRYGYTTTQSAPPVYVDCATMGTCAPQPTTVYTQPAPVQYQAAPTYTAPTTTYAAPAPTMMQAPANCPAGTTAQADGTCMQTSSSFGSTSSYSAPTTSYGSGSTYSAPSTSMPADCPAGTTAQSDGTCMQTSSSFGSTSSYSAPTTSYGSSSSYSAPTTSYGSASSAPANCPAGTTAQADGTCMQGGSSSSFMGSSVELYTGDATTSSNTTSSYGYTSDGVYAATDYLPIRK